MTEIRSFRREAVVSVGAVRRSVVSWSWRRRSAADTSTGAGREWGFVVSIWESWAKKEDMEGRRVGFLFGLDFMPCSTGRLLGR